MKGTFVERDRSGRRGSPRARRPQLPKKPCREGRLPMWWALCKGLSRACRRWLRRPASCTTCQASPLTCHRRAWSRLQAWRLASSLRGPCRHSGLCRGRCHLLSLFQKIHQITSCSSPTCRRRATSSCFPCFSTGSLGSRRSGWFLGGTTSPSWSLTVRCRQGPLETPCRASRSPRTTPWRSLLPRSSTLSPCLPGPLFWGHPLPPWFNPLKVSPPWGPSWSRVWVSGLHTALYPESVPRHCTWRC